MDESKGFYTRGYLPHIDAGGIAQFVTWRLADSLPASLYDSWRQELSEHPDAERARELYRRVEQHLDAGHGGCALRQPVAAESVQSALLFHHGRRVQLHAWVVMPNHVHVLCTPIEGFPLFRTVQAWKTFTSKEIRRALGGIDALWARDYFDRAIRDATHFAGVAKYIEWNPVKAGLCVDPARWPWSSANGRHAEVVDRGMWS